MRCKLAWIAILLCTGCGGGSSKSAADASTDTGATTDAPTGQVFCDSVSQQGCGDGQKCTWVTIPSMDLGGELTCVPDGNVPLGGTCIQGTPGATTGYDNCAKGGLCSNGTCVELCGDTPGDTCPSDRICQIAPPVPVCVPACDPVKQLDPDYTDCPAGDGCYLRTFDGKALCLAVPAEAATQKQDDACYSPFGTAACADNGCAAGYQGLLAPDFQCSAFCAPANNYKTSHNQLIGIAPDVCSAAHMGKSGSECRFLQGIYFGDPIPPTYGTCTDVSAWGTCANYDPQGMVNTYNTAYTSAPGNATARAAAGHKALCQFCGLNATTCQGTIAPQCASAGCLDRTTQDGFDAMYLGPPGSAPARPIREMAVEQVRERAQAMAR
jgi:hypothetical protein